VDYRVVAVLALLCWGAWGFLTKLVSRSESAQTITFWNTMASILPAVVFAFAGPTRAGLKPTWLLLVSGLAGGLATVFFYIAIRKGPAAVVVPLSGMYILVPAVLGYVLLKEPVTVSHVVGLACAALAVFFLSR
jgi:bacterial/archaeal transporter family protein